MWCDFMDSMFQSPLMLLKSGSMPSIGDGFSEEIAPTFESTKDIDPSVLWVFHRFSMDFSWIFHGFFIDFHPFSMGFSLIFHGFSWFSEAFRAGAHRARAAGPRDLADGAQGEGEADPGRRRHGQRERLSALK